MWYRRRHRVRQMALVMVAAPAAAWALEQAARRAEARDKTSPASRRLRQGADLASAFHGLAVWFAVGWDSRQGLAAGGVRCGGGARVGGLERLARHDHR